MTATRNTTSIGAAMLEAIALGFSIVPINERTKQPHMQLLPKNPVTGKPEWMPFTVRPPTPEEVQQWIDADVKAFAVVCGEVSGNLEILDFDVEGYFENWRAEVGELFDGVPLQKTGGGTWQIAYRSATPPPPNDKLAFHPNEGNESGREAAIETRGHHGYAVMPPSIHPTGNRYGWALGSLATVPTISQARIDAFKAAAKKLCQAPYTKQELENAKLAAEKIRERKDRAKLNGDVSIINEFNDAHDIRAILRQHGYSDRGARMIRPNPEPLSAPGVTILTGSNGREVSYHHSTNDPLNGPHCCDAFDVFCRLSHGGDVKKAARAAAELLGLNQSHKKSKPTPQDQPQAESSESQDEYPDLIPLTEPDPPTFPDGVLSGWLKEFAEAVAGETETPLDLAASAGLATIATIAQGRFSIRPEPNYFESLNIYAAVFLDSGARKSAVLKRMLLPLVEWEQAAGAAVAAEIKRAEVARNLATGQIKNVERRAASGEIQPDEAAKQIEEIEAKTPPVPYMPRLFTGEVTAEHLAVLMQRHNERMAVISDEAGFFEVLAGRYTKGDPNLDIVLQGFSASFVRVDRGSRPPVLLNHPTLTIFLSPQPVIASQITDKPGFRSRGLLARFCFAIPTSTLGTRTLQSRPVDDAVASLYCEQVKALLELPTTDHPHVLTFSRDAYAVWKSYQRAIECAMSKGGKLQHVRDVGGRWPGIAARLAGLLHIADFGVSAADHREIPHGTMVRAVEVAEHYLAHGLRVLGAMRADPALHVAREIWDAITQIGESSITARDVYRLIRGRYPTVAELEPGFGVLVDRGWLIEREEDERRRGRPSRPFVVNPKTNIGHFGHAHR
jgi:hypothetical protein